MIKGTALASAQGRRCFWAIGGDFNCSIADAVKGITNCPQAAGNYAMAFDEVRKRRDFIVMCGKASKQREPRVPISSWDNQHVAVFMEGSPWDQTALAPTQGRFLHQATSLQERIALFAPDMETESEGEDADMETETLEVISANAAMQSPRDTGGATSSASLAPTQGDDAPPQGHDAATQKKRAQEWLDAPPEEPPAEPPAKRSSPPRPAEQDKGAAMEGEDKDASCANAEEKEDQENKEEDEVDFGEPKEDEQKEDEQAKEDEDTSCANAEEKPKALPNIRFVDKRENTYVFNMDINREYLAGGGWGEALAPTQGSGGGSQGLTRSLTHSLTHSRHSLTPLTHSRHSLTQSPTHWGQPLLQRRAGEVISDLLAPGGFHTRSAGSPRKMSGSQRLARGRVSAQRGPKAGTEGDEDRVGDHG